MLLHKISKNASHMKTVLCESKIVCPDSTLCFFKVTDENFQIYN